jgi:glycerol kinase
MSSNKKDLLLAIDQGTTGTTVLIVNPKLQILSSFDLDFKQIYPKPGWVEHNLNDIWTTVEKCITGALKKAKISSKRIAAIGITNQRETTCLWNKKTGKPLQNAIVWQDRRTADLCSSLKKDHLEPLIVQKTGLLLDPYFSGTKVRWSVENNLEVKKAIAKKDCAFGTIDSYLIFKLTGGLSHCTEPSNASRTLLFNIESNTWDQDLTKLFKVDHSMLPEIKNSADFFGATKGLKFLPDGIPITGVLGDQQAALLGQACIETGQAKCTYGTGSFILLNTGPEIKRSAHKLLSTVAWKFNNKTTYALEGGAFTAGASVQWFRDGLGLIETSSEIEKLASSVKSSDGVVFIPAFTGIGAPHWNPHARAAYFGISRGTTAAHMARALLEGVALMNYDILKSMEKDLGHRLVSLNVDGGASKNNLLMQTQCDLLQIDLVRPKMVETTSLGAIFAAGLGIGIWKSLAEIKKSWKKDKVFSNKMPDAVRSKLLENWNTCIKRV